MILVSPNVSLSLSLSLITSCGLLAQPDGSAKLARIAGTVLAPDGKTIANIRVRAVRIKPTFWTSPTVDSGPTGTFAIPDVPDGSYVLCGQARHRLLLADPCFGLGPDTAPSIVVNRGVSSGPLTLQMEEGALVTVRLKDPNGLLRERGASRPGQLESRLVRASLFAPGRTVPIPLDATRPETDGQSYLTVVPRRMPSVRLSVDAAAISIKEEGPSTAKGEPRFEKNLPVPNQRKPRIDVTIVADRP